jgi:hypothetical protein
VARIRLNPQLTGGYDFDNRLGDEGLLVVIEPQDAAGQYLPISGNVSVRVTDPEQPRTEARVARWDFDEVEAAGHMKKSLFGKGIHLKLPWPAEPPTNRKLRVEVQYATTSGRLLRAQRDITIDLPAPGPAHLDRVNHAGWSPRGASHAAASAESERQGAEPRSARRPNWSPFR